MGWMTLNDCMNGGKLLNGQIENGLMGFGLILFDSWVCAARFQH
jgi:hypothetical protein